MNGLDPDQDQHSVGPDLVPNCQQTINMRRSRNFRQGGVQVSLTKKNLTFFCCYFFVVFFSFSFFSPQLILQKSNGQFQRNLSFFKVPEGVQHFTGGGGGEGGPNLFPGGGPIAYSL